MSALPQVNLLPPEVTAARALDVLKRWLALGVVGVLVLTAGAYVLAAGQAKHAENSLTDAQATTATLLQQKSKYVKVTTVLTDLGTLKSAITLASSTEVNWEGQIAALAAVTPATVSIEQLVVESSTPMSRLQVSGDVLAVPVLARISFTARATSPINSTEWLDAMASVPTFVDPTLSSVAVAGDDKTDPYWVLTGSVSVSDLALSHRFDSTEVTK